MNERVAKRQCSTRLAMSDSYRVPSLFGKRSLEEIMPSVACYVVSRGTDGDKMYSTRSEV